MPCADSEAARRQRIAAQLAEFDSLGEASSGGGNDSGGGGGKVQKPPHASAQVGPWFTANEAERLTP